MEYKSKWELKYEAFKNGDIDKDIEELNKKKKEMADTFVVAYNAEKKEDANKAQTKMNEIQDKLDEKEKSKSSIKANQAKIENILQLKKDLIKESYMLIKQQKDNAEYEKVKQYVKDNADNYQAISMDIIKNDFKIKQFEEKLKDPKIAPEEKEKLEKEKGKLEEDNKQKRALAGEYVSTCQKKEQYESEVGNYNKETVEKALAKNEKLIAKCDLIGANLVRGKSMEEIKASLNNFKFKKNPDFAKKIETMRKVYEKEERVEVEGVTKDEEEAKDEVEKAEEAKNLAKEKAEAAIKAAKEAEEEYKKISNLPAPKPKLYEKIPGAKRVADFVSKLLKRKNKDSATKTAEEAKKEVEKAKAEAESAKTEYENAEKAAKEAKAKAEEAKKIKSDVELKTEKRSTEYLKKLRTKKQDEVLEGMTIYGDTFKDRLKFKMPNVKTSLTQDEIDRAKSKTNYVTPNYKHHKDHEEDKRSYHVEKRKNEIRKNIEKMTGKTVDELKAEKRARQDGDER